MPAYSVSDNERLSDCVEAMRLIMPDVLEVEHELAHEKWFAYRFMSPMAATQLFASLYRLRFRRFVAEHKDRDEAERSVGLSFSLFDAPGPQLTRVWKARQHADRFCLPYDLLINFGFDFAGRRKWRRAPTPAQMFGSRDSVEEWTRKFELYAEENLGLLVDSMPALAPYQNEHFRDLRDQSKFRDFLTRHIQIPGKSWATKLGNHCTKKRHLPLAAGMALVPEEERQNVIDDIRRDIDLDLIEFGPKLDLPDIALAPSCIGLGPAHQKHELQCAACPFATKCRDMSVLASNTMNQQFGSVSPVEQQRLINRREKTKLRVRAHRKNKQDLASSNSPDACSLAGIASM